MQLSYNAICVQLDFNSLLNLCTNTSSSKTKYCKYISSCITWRQCVIVTNQVGFVCKTVKSATLSNIHFLKSSEFHFSKFEGKVWAPVVPSHTIRCRAYISIVHAIEIWILAALVPPGTCVELCTVYMTPCIIVLVSCAKPTSIMESKRVSCSSAVSWYW